MRLVTVFELTPVACRYNGFQQFPGRKGFELWTPVESCVVPRPVSDLLIVKHSTISAKTLAHYSLVPVPVIA